MTFPRRILLGAVAATAIVGALTFVANAQTAPSERIVGYSVYAHSQYVLLQRPDGSLRTCSRGRDSIIRRTEWECEDQGALPR
jgi:hypothetical protein